VVSLNCYGETTATELASAQSDFHTETGWYLELEGVTIVAADPSKVSSENDEQVDAPAHFVSSEVKQTRRTSPINQHDALQYAQQLLNGLPGYQKAGLEVGTSTLVLRFHFPKAAQTRYADIFAELEAETGWSVRLHPTTNQQALIEMAHNLLPPGLTCNGTPSLYLDAQTVGVQCLGNATSEAIQETEQLFLAETGWQLNLVLPGQKAATPSRVPQGQAISMASAMFSTVPDFYRVSVDPTKGNIWLHFHFPEVARQRYLEQLTTLANETGWRVYLHPNAHQKALLEAARRLLPEGVGINGKASIYQESRTLTLPCTAPLSTEIQETMQRQFAEETGWQLNLLVPV
jgi:hypothetical protein